MTINIRKAKPSDAAIISLIGRLTFRETFGALFSEHEDDLCEYLDRTFSVAKIASSIAKPENHYWLSTLNELPVGYAKQKFPSPHSLITAAPIAQLQKIYVLSEFLQLHIGHALLDATMRQATAAKVNVMWLTVLKTNERAIRFYHRHGWESAGHQSFTIGSQDFAFLVLKIEAYKKS